MATDNANYDMFLKSMAMMQVIAYCQDTGEDVEDVSSRLYNNAKRKWQEHTDVDFAMTWKFTPEGHDYWSKVNSY